MRTHTQHRLTVKSSYISCADDSPLRDQKSLMESCLTSVRFQKVSRLSFGHFVSLERFKNPKCNIPVVSHRTTDTLNKNPTQTREYQYIERDRYVIFSKRRKTTSNTNTHTESSDFPKRNQNNNRDHHKYQLTGLQKSWVITIHDPRQQLQYQYNCTNNYNCTPTITAYPSLH